MARTFRRQRQAQPIADLNVTNLIDLGFTLLIIFMITTSYSSKEQTVAVNLPVTSVSPTEKPDPSARHQIIVVDAKGRYFWGNKPVSLAQLGTYLDEAAAQPKPPIIDIRGDAAVDYQKIMTVIDELKKRGLSKLGLPTQNER